MKFFNKLELKYGRYAIPNLMLYLTAMYVAGFVIQLMLPQVYLSFLSLNWTYILKGQVWRLVTWLMYPPSDNIIIGALMIYVYYSIGTTVERLWGSFKFNIFIFSLNSLSGWSKRQYETNSLPFNCISSSVISTFISIYFLQRYKKRRHQSRP